jgi:hypothetical protein
MRLTSSISAHTRRPQRIVFVEAALLDELLGHDIAGGEENLVASISLVVLDYTPSPNSYVRDCLPALPRMPL